MITVLESRSREARCWQPWFLSGFLWENPVRSRLAAASLQPRFPSSHGFLLFALSSSCKDASLWVGPPQKISRFLIVSAHILFPKRVALTGAGGYDMDMFFLRARRDTIQLTTCRNKNRIDTILISKIGYNKIMKQYFPSSRGNGFEHKLSFKCEVKWSHIRQVRTQNIYQPSNSSLEELLYLASV